MQRSGLEWLWRIKEESQLARRYFNDGLWLIRTLIRVVLPLAACRYLERDTTSAMLEINDEKGILQLAGNWRDADLLKLCAAIDAHLQRVNTTFRMLDLSCLRTINPAISARLIQLTTMSSGQNPEVTWPAKSSLAFKQLYAQQFRQSRRLIHR
jgi:ABC-type transporter Mla MlaB component